MAASNIYDITAALSNIKAPAYDPRILASLDANLASRTADIQGMVDNTKGFGSTILDAGTSIQKFKTDQFKNALAQQSRAGMQLDPVTGQPIDPTGDKLTEIMNRAASAKNNATGFDSAGMVDLNALDQYQNKLAGDRRVTAKEFRDVAEEKQLRSLDEYKQTEARLNNSLNEQQLNIRGHQERRDELKQQMGLELDTEKLFKMQQEYDQLEGKIPFLLEELQANIANKNASTGKLTAETASLAVKDTKESVLTDIQRQNLKAKKRENKEAERKEKNAIEMAPQFEKITAAQAVDAKAGTTDFAASAEFKEYNRLINLNRKNRRKNEALQGEFAERIKNLNLPITEEQLITAGVRTNPLVDADGQPLKGEYDYSPSARSRLDKVLARAHGTTFGTQGTPTAAVLNQLGKSAISQNGQLSVGFKDAADVAAKDKVARDTIDFNKDLQAGIDNFRYDKPGADLDAKVKAFRKTLSAGPYVPGKAKLINDTLQPFIDRNLTNSTIKLALGKSTKTGKVIWNKEAMDKYGLSSIDIKSKTMTSSKYSTFESRFRRKVANANIGASKSAINEQASLSLSAIPGYINDKLRAKLQTEVNALVDAQNMQTPVMIAKDVGEMTAAIESKGHIAYMEGYLKKNHGPAYANSVQLDLQQELKDVVKTAENLYDAQLRGSDGKIDMTARATLYNGVLKMYAGSTGASNYFWHDTVGPEGTSTGIIGLMNFGIAQLEGDKFRKAIEPHIPNNLLGKPLTKAERLKQALANAERIRNEKE